MKEFRLTFSLKGIPAGNLDVRGDAGVELALLLTSLLQGNPEWNIIQSEKCGEKRILESTPQGIRLLSSESVYQQSDMPLTR